MPKAINKSTVGVFSKNKMSHTRIVVYEGNEFTKQGKNQEADKKDTSTCILSKCRCSLGKFSATSYLNTYTQKVKSYFKH